MTGRFSDESMFGLSARVQKPFLTFYQSKVEFRSGQLSGVAALPRWMLTQHVVPHFNVNTNDYDFPVINVFG